MEKILINPPPRDRCCECCGNKNLKPFGKGNFEGALLVKTFRDRMGWISASWECKDCLFLSDEDFGRKKNEM